MQTDFRATEDVIQERYPGMNGTIFEIQECTFSAWRFNLVDSIILNLQIFDDPLSQFFRLALLFKNICTDDNVILIVVTGQDTRIGFNSIENQLLWWSSLLTLCFYNGMEPAILLLGTDQKEYLVTACIDLSPKVLSQSDFWYEADRRVWFTRLH